MSSSNQQAVHCTTPIDIKDMPEPLEEYISGSSCKTWFWPGHREIYVLGSSYNYPLIILEDDDISCRIDPVLFWDVIGPMLKRGLSSELKNEIKNRKKLDGNSDVKDLIYKTGGTVTNEISDNSE